MTRFLTIALMLSLLLAGGAYASHHAGIIENISGSVRFAMVESSSPGRPAFDSPQWTDLTLDESGLSSPLPQKEGVAWLTIRFTLPAALEGKPLAILISEPADADEIYVNGKKIGGVGQIGVLRYNAVPNGPRFYEIPEDTEISGETELSMKVLFTGRNLNAYNGPIQIGERHAIEREFDQGLHYIISVEAAFLSMFALLIAFYCFLIIKGIVRSDYVLFVSFMIVHSTIFLLDSEIFHHNWPDIGFISHIMVALSSLQSILMLTLVAKLTESREGILFKSFVLLAAIITAADIFLPPMGVLVHFSVYRSIFKILLGIYYIYMAIKSLAAKNKESLPVFCGVVFYVVGSRVDMLVGIPARDYGVSLFALCMLYALTSRHARFRNSLVEVSAKLLDAHEEERRRLARDIHDGVGQSLLGLKLRLQMASAKIKAGASADSEALDGMVGDTAAIIEEVRRTARDLRPSFIENTNLPDAMKWYAETFVSKGDCELHFHIGKEAIPEPPPRTKDNIYRIFQEILSNTIKHSLATRVDISLYYSDKKLILIATDNGVGMTGAEGAKGGIGLLTMQERAQLIGGRCWIESFPDVGTTVKVEVPL